MQHGLSAKAPSFGSWIIPVKWTRMQHTNRTKYTGEETFGSNPFNSVINTASAASGRLKERLAGVCTNLNLESAQRRTQSFLDTLHRACSTDKRTNLQGLQNHKHHKTTASEPKQALTVHYTTQRVAEPATLALLAFLPRCCYCTAGALRENQIASNQIKIESIHITIKIALPSHDRLQAYHGIPQVPVASPYSRTARPSALVTTPWPI